MIRAADRAKSVLRAIVAFARERDRWPNVEDLRSFRRRPNLGGTTTVLVTLRYLRDLGFVELRGAAQTARWCATDDGFALLGRPTFAPKMEAQRARAAAQTLLCDHPAQTIRNVPWAVPAARSTLFAAGLDVAE